MEENSKQVSLQSFIQYVEGARNEKAATPKKSFWNKYGDTAKIICGIASVIGAILLLKEFIIMFGNKG